MKLTQKIYLLIFIIFPLFSFSQGEIAEKYAGGNGLEENPFQIETLPQLRKLSETPEDWDKYFIQTSDINAAETKDHPFTSIGNESVNFTGTYDGQSNTISNLSYNSLFGYITDAFVENVILKDVFFDGSGSYAALCIQSRGFIYNCNIQGEINESYEWTTLVQPEFIVYNHGIIADCNSENTSYDQSVLVDYNSGIIYNSKSNNYTIEDGWNDGAIIYPDADTSAILIATKNNNSHGTLTVEKRNYSNFNGERPEDHREYDHYSKTTIKPGIVYPKDTIILNIEENLDYEFVAWVYGTDTLSKEKEFSFVVEKEQAEGLDPVRIIKAVYKKYDGFVVDIDFNERLGNIEGIGKYNDGNTITLSATPKEGFVFEGWSNGSDLIKENPYSFVADPLTITDKNIKFEALFRAESPITEPVCYVTTRGAGTKDGKSWKNAFSGESLQSIIDRALSGTQIWVRHGEYTNENGFHLKDGVKIYGGFLGTEESLEQRNWSRYKTVLKNTIYSNHAEAVLNGIEISANNVGISTNGGVFINCNIKNNQTGITGEDGSFINCIVENNSRGVKAFSGELINCNITTNKIGIEYSTCDVKNSILWGNGEGSAHQLKHFNGKLSHSAILTDEVDYIYQPRYSESYLKSIKVTFEGEALIETSCCNIFQKSEDVTSEYLQGPDGYGGYYAKYHITDYYTISNALPASESPVINIGNTDFVATQTDYSGKTRINDGTVDIGAYEYIPVVETTPYLIDPVADNQNGTVTSNINNPRIGDKITLKVTANEGKRFVAWVHKGDTVSFQSEYSFTYVNPPKDENDVLQTYTAFFEYTHHYEISVNCEPNEGTVKGNGAFNAGDEITIEAEANEKYNFIGWVSESDTVSKENPYTFSFTAIPPAGTQPNKTFTAIFDYTHDYEVKAAPLTPGGTVEGAGKYDIAEEITLKASPLEGFKFLAWISEGDTVSKSPKFTLSFSESPKNDEDRYKSFYAVFIDEAPFNGAVYYITPLGSGMKDGTSWKNAFAADQLQETINTASTPCQIWVQQGNYLPDTIGIENKRDACFSMRNGVELYGGFDGTEKHLNQRNWVKNRTVLSGNIGDVHYNYLDDDNCKIVIHNTDELDNTAILDGFVIEKVAKGGTAINTQGGRFLNCLIRRNYYGLVGSGTYINCIIDHNDAAPIYKFTGTLLNCNLTYNEKEAHSSDISIHNCIERGSFSGDVSHNSNGYNSGYFNKISTCYTISGSFLGTGPDQSSVRKRTIDAGLLPTSSFIDKGSISFEHLPYDFGGKPRVINASIDIGAYEYNEGGSVFETQLLFHIPPQKINYNENFKGIILSDYFDCEKYSDITFTPSDNINITISREYAYVDEYSDIIFDLGYTFASLKHNDEWYGTEDVKFIGQTKEGLFDTINVSLTRTPAISFGEFSNGTITYYADQQLVHSSLTTDFVATPDENYQFTGWQNENGEIISTNNTLNIFDLKGEVKLFPVFEKNIFSFEAKQNEGGTSSLSSNQVNVGESVTLTITIDEDHQIDSVHYNGINITAELSENTYTIEDVKEDGVFEIWFSTFTKIILGESMNGTAEYQSNGTAIDSSLATEIFAIADECCTFKHWEDKDGNILSTDLLFPISDLTGEVSLTPIFETKSFTIQVSSSTGGTATVNNETVEYGGSVSVDIQADENNQIDSAHYNGINITAEISENSYTIENIKEDGVFEVWFSQLQETSIASEQLISVFPNPAKDIINVKTNNLQRVSIITNDGKEIHSILSYGNKVECNIENIKPGHYILKIETKNSTFHKTILIH